MVEIDAATPREALDPATPPALLGRIALHRPDLRRYVAVNPAAGRDLLTWLADLGDPALGRVLAARAGPVAPPQPPPPSPPAVGSPLARRGLIAGAVAVALVLVAALVVGLVRSAGSHRPVTEVSATILVGDWPRELAVDHGTVYVASFDDATLSAIDVELGTVVVDSVQASGIMTTLDIDPATHLAYVVSVAPGVVSAYDLTTGRAVGSVEVCGTPTGADLDPLAELLYVTCPEASQVWVVDVATMLVADTISVGLGAGKVAMDGSAGTAVVTRWTEGTVSLIDTTTGRVEDVIDVGSGVSRAVVDESTGTAYLSNVKTGRLTLVDLATAEVIDAVDLGFTYQSAQGNAELVVDPLAGVVYATSVDRVLVFDTSTRTVVDEIRVGGFVSGIVVDPATGQVYVSIAEQGVVKVLTAAERTPLTPARRPGPADLNRSRPIADTLGSDSAADAGRATAATGSLAPDRRGRRTR